VMSDLPRLGALDVERLLVALRDADVAIAPDRPQLGTNALALRLPAPLATCFGNADSFARHLAAAETRALRAAVIHARGLAFDLDRPADLAALVSLQA
jgi:2-phospho-L-lactate guanylyltransferase